jgi:hypothetical protein
MIVLAVTRIDIDVEKTQKFGRFCVLDSKDFNIGMPNMVTGDVCDNFNFQAKVVSKTLSILQMVLSARKYSEITP